MPWANLGREPVVCEFDRLYILVGPRADNDASAGGGPAGSSAPAGAASTSSGGDVLAAKRQRVLETEMQWLADKDANEPHQPGRFKGLIDTVIGNLQLRITNVHVRYEDGTSWPGHTMALGLTLKEISAHTIDDAGRRAFVKSQVGGRHWQGGPPTPPPPLSMHARGHSLAARLVRSRHPGFMQEPRRDGAMSLLPTCMLHAPSSPSFC